LGTILIPRFRWLLLPTLLLANPSFFYHLFLGEGMQTVMWESTRTIVNTINEYPIFSFLWGDVHPHVMSIFNQVFLILLLVSAYRGWDRLEKTGQWLLIGLVALSLGSMPGINTWDVLIYAPVTLVFGLLIWRRYRRSDVLFDPAALRFLIAVPPLAVLSYLPFYLQLSSQGIEGILLVPTPSEPLQFLLVHGFFLAVFFVYIGRDIVKRPYLALAVAPFLAFGYAAAAIAALPLAFLAARKEHTIPEIFAIAGLALSILCEILYFKDNMGDVYYRMNTVFKCYIPVWLMMSVGAFSMIGGYLERVKIPWRILPVHRRALAVCAVAGLLVLPFALNINFGPGTHTLDGLAYLEGTNPGDAEAVRYLASLPVGDLIVEAEGGDYAYYSRIASFSGIPGIVGQPFHEYMWRGDTAEVMERAADVRTIYEDPSRTLDLMNKYNATLLYVGPTENEHYHVDLPTEELELVYDRSGVLIYRLPV
ncbi:MAG TPA: DUF2298 domain-containing protein, partial [Methanomicrobiales archaeon]|nr:DUF2298 domain-containing protein [Methanomicrobiales archaeon]